jgi:hypothetical protein
MTARSPNDSRDALLLDPAHDRELDEMIAMGWGDVPQAEIPPCWRTRRGPGQLRTETQKLNISRGIRNRLKARQASCA